jgi:hypothetical protein
MSADAPSGFYITFPTGIKVTEVIPFDNATEWQERLKAALERAQRFENLLAEAAIREQQDKLTIERLQKEFNAEVSEGGTRDSRIETAAQSRPSLH